MPVVDKIVERIRRVREKLLQEHGGLDGYFEYLLELDRQRLARERRQRIQKKKSAKRTASRGSRTTRRVTRKAASRST